jgi:membrane protein YqaA with SNARE-associated domain
MILPIVFTTFEWLAVLAGLVVVNTIPLFMPPTWAVLAWLHVQESVPIWGLAAAGAIGSTIGRGTLAMVSRLAGPRILPRRWRANIQAVVDLLLSRSSLRASSLALFAWGPVSSNYLFIAAGISGAPLLLPLIVYAIARFISYMVVVSATQTTVNSFNDLLDPGMDRGWFAALQLVGIVTLIIVMRYDWSKITTRLMPRSQATERTRNDAGPEQ